MILNADTTTPANRLSLKNYLVLQFDDNANILIQFADECMNNALVSTAQVCLEAATDLKPLNSGMWNKRGVVLMQGQDYQMAKECFQRALLIDPVYEEAQENLSNVKMNYN